MSATAPDAAAEQAPAGAAAGPARKRVRKAPKPELVGRIEPRLDPFTDTGRDIRDRQGKTAVRLRREGFTFAEIASVMHISEDLARALVRARARRLMLDSKAWTAARRARLLAQLERDECGPKTWGARVTAVIEARQSGDTNALIGALNDLASGSIAWAQWLRRHRELVGR